MRLAAALLIACFASLWWTAGVHAETAPSPLRLSGPQGAGGFVQFGNAAVAFLGYDPAHGLELWRTDGTDAGTRMVKDIRPSGGDSFPGYLTMTNVDGTLYFVADDGSTGAELWKSNGTEAGTVQVVDINAGFGDAFSVLHRNFNSQAFVSLNGEVFFSASDGVNGYELWKSDGTAAGTVRVTDINPGSGDADPGPMAVVNGVLFFAADDGGSGRELYRSDGTASGTMRLTDLHLAWNTVPGEMMLAFNGKLVFNPGVQLWTSDGTPAGTVQLGDVGGTELTPVGATLFFSGGSATGHGTELWKSDGTSAGTAEVADLYPGTGFGGYANSSFPRHLARVGNELYFAATDGSSGFELWKSDGSTAGTSRVADINPGTSSVYIASLAGMGNRLILSADDGSHGVELWTSDGTAQGTRMIADLNAGTAPSSPLQFTALDSTRFVFSADDGVHGRGLWTMDLGSPGVRVTLSEGNGGATDWRTCAILLLSLLPWMVAGWRKRSG